VEVGPEVNAADNDPEVNAAGDDPELNAAGDDPEVNAAGDDPELPAGVTNGVAAATPNNTLCYGTSKLGLALSSRHQ